LKLNIAKKRPPLKQKNRQGVDETTPNIDGNDIKFIYRYITYQYDI